MIAYTLRRLFGAIPVVFIGITITFLIIHLAPGDPTSCFLTPTMSAGSQEIIIERFGLNNPIYVQYFKWLYRIISHFDFGNSFNSGRPASDIIFDALPSTLLLTGLSLISGLIFGTLLGILSAIYKGTSIDRFLTTIMLFFYSMPAFWIGLMLLSLFAIKLNLLPASQLISVFHDQLSIVARIFDYAKHLILPVLTLGLAISATFYRYARTSMIESLNSDYITAAKARGIKRRKVIFTYGLRNALIPLISLLGLSIPLLFSGAVIIEVIFSLPGMGRVMVNAVLSRDYPIILAASTLAFISVTIGNMLADIAYAVADPRIRFKENYN